jgi:t-SNARE complex subunit (syntaxin)
VEDSFKLTILEIKKSNERLEQAIGQIENHYIGKLDLKERECEQARTDRKSLESHCNELERKLTGLESQYGSEIKEKNLYINSLSTNHNQTREEIA